MGKLNTAVILILLMQGCIQTIAIRTVGDILNYGFEAFNEESDLELAKDALGSNLKLLEALIKGDPENAHLLLMASQGYSAYALAFAEDENPDRAREFYRRGSEYARRILRENEGFQKTENGSLDAFAKALNEFSRQDVPAIFWAAFGWGAYINVSKSDPGALADLGKVNAMMEFVLKHNPSFYYGGAHLYFGSVLASTPVMLGGKPEKAKEHFEKGIALSNGRFLMMHVYYAKTYAVQTQDQELFESLLRKVIEASRESPPELRFANAVARKKAELLLTQVEDNF